jgi:hypothetical protein
MMPCGVHPVEEAGISRIGGRSCGSVRTFLLLDQRCHKLAPSVRLGRGSPEILRRALVGG